MPYQLGFTAVYLRKVLRGIFMSGELLKDFGILVAKLAKDPLDIQLQLDEDKIDLWHGATGVATEAGELLDAAKKFAVYNKDLDRDNIIEELGDLEFYMELVRSTLGVTREQTLEVNMAKLQKRYAKGYSDQAAQVRADKVVETESSGVTE